MEPDEVDLLLRQWFDEAFYRSAYLSPDDPRDPWQTFLAEGDRGHHRPSPAFDPDFYRGRYKDARDSNMPPLRHFVRKGQTRGYAPNRFRHLLQSGRAGPLLDGVLLGIAPVAGEPEDMRLARIEEAYERYLIALRDDPWRDPSPGFSVAFYAERHPDVHRGGGHGFLHYVDHGHREGRETSAEVLASLRDGARALDPARPSVVVCLHELSLTGAPVVGLDLIEALAATHNVMCLSRRGGPLEERVAAATVHYSIGATGPAHAMVLANELARRTAIDFALVNSVEAWHCLPALNLIGAPILTLIHEYADYVFPRERVAATVLLSDRLLFSSHAIARTWEAEIARRYEFTFRHATIRHQAPAAIEIDPARDPAAVRARLAEELALPLVGRKIVLGAGSVQLRKGTDLFVATAQAFERLVRDGALAEDEPVVFLWVGGVPDRSEFGFGLWLAQQVDRAAPGRLAMVPPGPYYRDLIASADLLFLSSRLDPFPNVVIDALCAGTPVLLFDDATGCPEALDRDGVPYLAAAFGDVLDAARRVAAGLAAPPAREELSALARAAFAFDPYVADILGAVDAIRADRAAAEGHPLAPGFDPDYFRMPFAASFFRRERDPALLRRFWLRALHAGFDAFNPGAGVNLRNAIEERWLAQAPRRTHRALALPTIVPAPDAAAAPSFAIHYHAHFIDDFPDLCARYGETFGAAARLIVTTDEADKRHALMVAAATAGISCEVLCVVNRARNFGPLFELAERGAFAGCDLVLHVHAKRSARLGETRAGRWRDYLHDMLLAPARAARVRALFATEPGLGSVWPENQRALGWGETFAEAQRVLGEDHPLPPSPRQFPNGAMMWVRREVLETLWRSLGLALDALPDEPIPDDGSLLHALERLWPDLVTRTGADWATIWDAGSSRY